MKGFAPGASALGTEMVRVIFPTPQCYHAHQNLQETNLTLASLSN